MKSKKNIDIQAFLKEVLSCKGEIFYDTEYKDHLNLKSQLSKFIFAILYTKESNMLLGEITLHNPDDVYLLSKYLY